MQTTRWGIIGPGSIAGTFTRDLSLVANAQTVEAVLGHSSESTVAFAREFNVPHLFTREAGWLERTRPDIVYVASPHPYHFEQTLACLENKIPVLCEKPMTINSRQCRQLIEAARTNNTFLMEGMWIRFLPSLQMALSLIEAGRIGRIQAIRASTTFKAPPDHSSRYFDPAKGGGSLLDLGIYPVYLAMLMLGKPDTIKAIANLTNENIDESCSILFQYQNGAYAMLESSLISDTDSPAEITGEKGTIRILHPWFEKAPGIELRTEEEGKIIYPCSWKGHGMQFETEEALRCLSENRIETPLHTHADSLHLITVLDEIRDLVNISYPSERSGSG